MVRMPWRNESRICRYPFDIGSGGPTKEEKLRKKYPELQEKWEEYIRCDSIYDDVIPKRNNKKRNVALKNLKKAKKDYEFLKKILWDY